MTRMCAITGKRPVAGNNVSHAHNKTKRKFVPNLHTRRYWVPNQNRHITLQVSAKGIRIIDKLGIEAALLAAIKKSSRGKATEK